jgi:hypothetical protein
VDIEIPIGHGAIRNGEVSLLPHAIAKYSTYKQYRAASIDDNTKDDDSMPTLRTSSWGLESCFHTSCCSTQRVKGVSSRKLADNADFVISFYTWMVTGLIKYFFLRLRNYFFLVQFSPFLGISKTYWILVFSMKQYMLL